MQEKLFVSYAPEDRGYVDKALGKLEREGVLSEPPVLIHDPVNDAPFIPGSSLRGALRNAIESASKVVLLWTADAAQSAHVNYEAGMADALDKPLIVVLPKDTAPELPANLHPERILQLKEAA